MKLLWRCDLESEEKKKIPYINIYVWNLKNWYRQSYLQSRNRDGFRKQMYGYQGGQEEQDELGD